MTSMFATNSFVTDIPNKTLEHTHPFLKLTATKRYFFKACGILLTQLLQTGLLV